MKFDTKGGTPSTITDQTVKYGQKAYKPTEPQKTDCKFDGWYTSPDYTQKWDFANDSVTKDITLYAKWIEKVTLHCDFQGGTRGSDTSYTAKAYPGEKAKMPWWGGITREGYSFIEWNDKPDGTGKSYSRTIDSITMPDHDLTLYAIWKKLDVIKVSFDAQGGYFPDIDNSTTWKFLVERPTGDDSKYVSDCGDYRRVDEESEIVKIVNGTRYRFKGWYLNPDDPKASESPAAVQLTAESPAEITFYAVWGEYIDMPFTVHYETFGVEEIPSRTIMESALENGGQLEEVPAPPAGSGITEWKWTVNLVELLMNSPKPEMQKEAKEYPVIYDANGGKNAPDMESYQFNALVNIADGVPERDGYQFIGWNTKADGSGVSYTKDDTFYMPCYMVTLYAQWKANTTYTVTYKDGVGGAAFGDQTTTGLHSGDQTPAFSGTPTRSGYTFKGWSPAVTATVTGNAVYIAQWAKNNSSSGHSTRYTLHYESNGGTSYKDESYSSGTTVTLDKVPIRESYTFTGWYADKELTKKISSIKMTSDKTVYAGWKASTVPDMLNGDDHYAYVIGYSDGNVRPNANVSRAETATIFFRLLNADIRDGNLTAENTFTDVVDGQWCNKSVSTMAKLGIVKGRTAEIFDPNAPITRAEFAVICARFDTKQTNGNNNFSDISGHWAEAEIKRAAALGWIAGYPDGTFRPNDYITRAQAMTMINRVLCRMPQDEEDLLGSMVVWPDNKPTDWHYLAVQEATNSHDFKRKGEVGEKWTKLTSAPDWTKYQ